MNLPRQNKPVVVVTGSGGQLGSEFQAIAEKYPELTFRYYSRKELDISKEESIKDLFEAVRPAYFINCAAYTAVDAAEDDREQAFKINATAVGLLAKYAATFNSRFIHFSTDYVFDGKKKSLYHVNDTVAPQTVYGASKAEGEKLALDANAESFIIRTSWVYSSFGKNFVKTILRLLSEREEIGVVRDQYGSPTYASDLAQTVMQIILDVENGKEWRPGLYHYCNAGVISWFQFATVIKEITESNCRVLPISTDQYPTHAKRPAYSALDCTKLNLNYGVRQIPWKESLIECLKVLVGRN